MKAPAIPFITEQMVEVGYRKCIAGADGNVEIIHSLELERAGGLCPYCMTPFRIVKVDNVYGRFDYYEPDCKCFARCHYCHRWLLAEKFLGIGHCTECRPHEYGVPTQHRVGAKRRRA